MLEHALQYAARGWRVFPCHGIKAGQCTCKKACSSPGKHPRTRHGIKDGTVDPVLIRSWWTRWPDANIGICTGGGLVVLDVDGADGAAELKALVAAHAPLPRTLVSATGRGVHLWLKTAKPIGSAAKGKLHVRGEGGYVIGPNSTHQSGRSYAWQNALDLADAPTWLEEWMASGGNSEGVFNRSIQRTDLPPYLSSRKPSGLAQSGLTAIRQAYSMDYAEIHDLLYQVSPDCDRDTWIKCLMAVKSAELVGEQGSDLGLNLVDDWSATATKDGKYRGSAHVEQQWNSLRADGGISIGSLRYYARNGVAPEPQPRANGQDSTQEQVNYTVPPFSPLNAYVDFRDFAASPAPERKWLVDGWIPAEEVTMLAGEGGFGKSTLVMQLALALASATDWLGLSVTPGRVLYYSAEDSRDEMHYRFEQIWRHSKTNDRAGEDCLAAIKAKDLSQSDPLLIDFVQGKIRASALFKEIEQAIAEHHASCVILDAVADMFGGDEIKRRDVRAFIGQLRALALRTHVAVIFLAHPSVEGIKSERGFSGSTHWVNAVRSFLRLYKPPNDTGAANDEVRCLEVEKTNRAIRGAKVYFTWLEGRYVPFTPGATVNPERELLGEETFLLLLHAAILQGRETSPYEQARNYAPMLLAKMSENKQQINKFELEKAMQRLFEKGRLKTEIIGPPSKQRQRLRIVS